MNSKEVTIYIDYKSPYAYLAKDPAYELERELNLGLNWLPYTLHIPDFLGTVEERNPHNWRRVRYSYMDARRLANLRGLTIRGPQKIFDSSIAAIGMLFAQRTGVFRKYNDIVFERFWKRELEIENPAVIGAVLKESGADASSFADFLASEGRAEHDRIAKEAEAIGVFGVPMFVLDGELFWGGDRMWLLRERLAGK